MKVQCECCGDWYPVGALNDDRHCPDCEFYLSVKERESDNIK